jgi:hypothetical protein
MFIALAVKARAPDARTAAHDTVATTGGLILTPFSLRIGADRANQGKCQTP